MAEATKKGMFEEESVRSFRTEERRVIFASSLGTVCEGCDFYLDALLAPHEPAPPRALDRRGHVVRHGERARALFVRVGEDPDVIEPRLADERLEFPEVRVGFSRETDDEGRPQCDARNTRSDPGQQDRVGRCPDGPRIGAAHRSVRRPARWRSGRRSRNR